MKNKQFESVLYSAGGVVALFVILIAFNFIAGGVKQRVDLTAEKAFTLSAGTRAILSKLDTPVKVRLYVTQDAAAMPVGLKNYAQRVEDTLDEYRQLARGKLIVEKFDPKPDSDAEDSARLDGVEGQMISPTEKVYLGLAVSQLDSKVALPALSPEREKLLEYDLSRAIAKVGTLEKPVVGVMSGLPIFGQRMNPMMAQMGQRGSEPWVFVGELKNDFNVKQVEITADKIEDDIKVLVLVHPKGISDATQFAIDQFILRGGKLIAFLDPSAYFDQQPGANPMMAANNPGSTLDKLLKAWGLEFDTAKVVADMTYMSRTQSGMAPAVLSLNSEAAADDIVTAQIDSLLIPFAGVFTGTPATGLKETVLLKTSAKSQMVDRFMAQMGGEQIANEFKASGKEFAIAVRLEGKFKTAFPDGKPQAAPEPGETNKIETAEATLKESKADNAVILFGDADLLNDAVSVEIQNFFGQRIVVPRNGNINLVQNAVEQMAGDSNLISIRSRASMNRPFIRVKQMEASARESYQAQIKTLEDEQRETQQRLNELQASKDKSQRMIMSPEQQKELENFRKKQAETAKQLKDLRKNLRRDIDALENKIKWFNILGMPLCVAVLGIAVAVVKKRRTSAR
ncbi:MAG: Gldg family protein [Opitutaceae bacterium]|nr:Gldg family protein [Verrucomicrobiales bacterium]